MQLTKDLVRGFSGFQVMIQDPGSGSRVIGKIVSADLEGWGDNRNIKMWWIWEARDKTYPTHRERWELVAIGELSERRVGVHGATLMKTTGGAFRLKMANPGKEVIFYPPKRPRVKRREVRGLVPTLR